MLRITKTNKKINFIDGCDIAQVATMTTKQAQMFASMLGKDVKQVYLKASCDIKNFLKVCDKIEISETPFTKISDDD